MTRDVEDWLELLEGDLSSRWSAIEHFLDHPDERAVEPLVAVALERCGLDDIPYYATEAILLVLGEEAFAERFSREYRSGSDEERWAAVKALAARTPEASREVLLEALEDESPNVVACAVGALGRLDDSSLADAIRPLVNHEDARISRAAIAAMSRLDPKSATEQAIEDLASADVEKRRNAAMQLVDRPSTLATEALIARIEDVDEVPQVRFKCVEALGMTRDERGFDTMLAALDDASSEVRSTAACFLGYFEDPRAIDALSDYLHARGDGEFAHGQAAIGLGHLGHPGAIETLLKALEDDRDNVRQWACDALRRINTPDEMLPAVVEGLVGRLEDESSAVRSYAI